MRLKNWEANGPRTAWLAGALILVLVLVAFWPVLHNGFIWDDDDHLTKNPCIVGPLGLREVWTSSHAVYYPLVLTTFWVLHQVVGLNPFPYHLLNVLLHGINAVLLWRVLRCLGVRGAWLGATLWAVHPVMVQSVAWITELKNTQSAFFYLLAILLFLQAEDGKESGVPSVRKLAGVLLLFALAITSKSSTVILPAVLALCLWWQRGRLRVRDGVALVPFLLLAAAAAVWTIWEQQFHSGALGQPWEQTWPQRIAIAGSDFWFYLGKLIWPHPLIFIYPPWKIETMPASAFLPALLAGLGLIFLWWKRHGPLRPVFFASAYFVIALSPVLGFFHVFFFRYSFVSDHFQYLASMGPLALAGATLTTAFDQWEGSFAGARLALVAVLLFALGFLTWRQSRTYRDGETLWISTIAKNPACWMAYNNLGQLAAEKGDINGAMTDYEKALEIYPESVGTLYNMANALATLDLIERAAAFFERALKVDPDYAPAQSNFANLLLERGDFDSAIAHYQRAAELEPANPRAHYNLAIGYLRKGWNEKAIPEFQAALRLQSDYPDASYFLAEAFYGRGQVPEAVTCWRKALETDPDNLDAEKRLAWVYATSGSAQVRNGSQAVRLAKLVRDKSTPNDPAALRILAAACAENGDFEEASRLVQLALESVQARNESAPSAEVLQGDLQLYRQNRPLRDDSH